MRPINPKRPRRKAAGTVQSITATSQVKHKHFTMLLNRYAILKNSGDNNDE
ncbi:hypothetical protein [uncultured Nitrosomonas sp.]|uniref:hypothetical protein n=1 Tax=uncultured Nitrosomonas sp. TaxID=156424 RepID=UPI0025F76F4F|nr:hypothetical protein [uncultured Nitrosomonas sp.]